jgi:hypothetical protein
LKTADTHRPALDTAEPCFVEEPDDLFGIDVTMPMKVRKESRLHLRDPEIDDQEAPARCEHATDFA